MHFVWLCIILYLYVRRCRNVPAVRHTAPACVLKKVGRRENQSYGYRILTRKKHPCGAQSFEVLRVGMDFKIRCTGCGREVMLPRAKIEKNIKKVIKPGQG